MNRSAGVTLCCRDSVGRPDDTARPIRTIGASELETDSCIGGTVTTAVHAGADIDHGLTIVEAAGRAEREGGFSAMIADPAGDHRLARIDRLRQAGHRQRPGNARRALPLAIAEILSRENNEILIIEKNKYLASETSKVFHEWLHTGALYTLVPDRMLTTRYLLGAIDDLLEYYSNFEGMNLSKTHSGLSITNQGWFNPEPMKFKYRARKMNPIWELVVAKSSIELDKISNHDWLRRRGGEDYGNLKLFDKRILKELINVYKDNKDFYEKQSSDLTMN